MPSYDLLMYRDFSDDVTGEMVRVGDDAAKLGDHFTGLTVVAVGRPIHGDSGKDATVVLAHSNRPMRALQRMLDGK